MDKKILSPLLKRRQFLKATTAAGAGVLSMPYLGRRALAAPTELTMLAWYGHAEPDMVAAFEAEHNVKFKPKYYTGGDNMLGLISQSPPGTFDLILSDAEYVQQLNAAGYIEELDPKDYPFDEYFPEFQKFQDHWKNGKLYSVLTRFGFLESPTIPMLSPKNRQAPIIFSGMKTLRVRLDILIGTCPIWVKSACLKAINLPMTSMGPPGAACKANWKSLRSHVGGFFDYGGTFSSLRNGQMLVMVGIGDWITGTLEKNGAKVRSVIPEEGGLQWTESFSIGKGSRKADLAKKWIQHISSVKGQVKSANMAAYPALIPNKKAWEQLAIETPSEAKRQGMLLNESNVMDLIRSGRIRYRQLPVQQSLEEWNDFWSSYKGS